jgi:hypothetical protein
MKRNIYIIILIISLTQIPVNLRAQESPVYKVSRLSFNSSIFNEISPVIVKDGLVFCSDRRFSGIKDRTAFDGRRLYNFYIVERKDTSGWKRPKEFKSERSSLFNNGPLCFAPDGKTVYFTSEIETGSPSKSRSFKNRSGIFIGDISGMELVSIRPFKYNDPEFSLGQPSISQDGKYLFFASDMPGGQGGSDIYFCELINGEWSTPVNLGPVVNSKGVENYPYMHPSGKLYFTSDRTGGLGGLDVYYTILNYGNWENPVLLPEPINSSSDDFAFVAKTDLQAGYFTSNRRKNDDIYEFSFAIIRKSSCGPLEENNFCYEFLEENAMRYDTIPFRFEWKFGDGNKGVGRIVEHCYPGPGSYLVQLDVVNLITNEISYNEKSNLLEVRVIEQPYISAPGVADAGKMIRFSADSTNLPGWKIAQYYWNFGDETISIGKEVEKAYKTPGTYNIQLIVSTEPEPGGMIREACISKNITIVHQP